MIVFTTREGRVAIVTGAAGGIGRATALTFAHTGVRVVAADVNLIGAEETAQQIIQNGGEAIATRTDVTQASAVEALVQTAIDHFGRLDYAHNNAGIAYDALTDMVATADHTEAMFDRIISVNLKGVWLCLKYELPRMVAQGSGAIVNTASVLGLVGSKGVAAYVASKHGVAGLTKTAALEYAQYRIRVNAISAGAMNSQPTRRSATFRPARFANGETRKPVASSADAAAIIALVAISRASPSRLRGAASSIASPARPSFARAARPVSPR